MSQSNSSVQNITSTEDEEEDDDQPLDSVLKGFHELSMNDSFLGRKPEIFQKSKVFNKFWSRIIKVPHF